MIAFRQEQIIKALADRQMTVKRLGVQLGIPAASLRKRGGRAG